MALVLSDSVLPSAADSAPLAANSSRCDADWQHTLIVAVAVVVCTGLVAVTVVVGSLLYLLGKYLSPRWQPYSSLKRSRLPTPVDVEAGNVAVETQPEPYHEGNLSFGPEVIAAQQAARPGGGGLNEMLMEGGHHVSTCLGNATPVTVVGAEPHVFQYPAADLCVRLTDRTASYVTMADANQHNYINIPTNVEQWQPLLVEEVYSLDSISGMATDHKYIPMSDISDSDSESDDEEYRHSGPAVVHQMPCAPVKEGESKWYAMPIKLTDSIEPSYVNVKVKDGKFVPMSDTSNSGSESDSESDDEEYKHRSPAIVHQIWSPMNDTLDTDSQSDDEEYRHSGPAVVHQMPCAPVKEGESKWYAMPIKLTSSTEPINVNPKGDIKHNENSSSDKVCCLPDANQHTYINIPTTEQECDWFHNSSTDEVDSSVSYSKMATRDVYVPMQSDTLESDILV